MKYLQIHKLLWLLSVIVCTAIEAVIILTIVVVHVLWNFTLPRNTWSKYHNSKQSISDTLNGIVYVDKNILQTIKRRYEMVFKQD